MPADELRDQLQSTVGSAYSIERELGGGGMSRVFVADETRLRRKIVIKVLSPELAAGISAERFEREIQLAAGLQQANIVPLITAGDTNGLPYYTMPFIEGLSLRARLSRNGALPVAEAIGVLRDVARALAYAHERGVVHRDIKPENILLSGDAAVVTDFGIAKALSASRTQAPGGTLTQVGTSLGTPAYMAPEQASGDPATDHRADIYALGCVAYEMLRGAAPFAGRPTHQLFAAHLNETPEAIERTRGDVPRALAALVARCTEKDPARRPQSAREILQALDTVNSSDVRVPPSAGVRRKTLIASAAGAVLVIAGVVYALPHRALPSADSAVGSVAVLPFENASNDTSSNYFADGMTDELATALAKVPGLHVASRTSSYTFRKHDGLDVREIAKKLGVGAVVEGSVRRAGSQVRVTAQLSRGSDGQSLWADGFTADASDVFAVQARLTQAIVTAITPTLAGGAPTAAVVATVAAPGTKDPVAYDAYLRARYELNRRGDGVRKSIALFHDAVARDPKFVDAWAGLTSAWAVLTDYDQTASVKLAADSVRATAVRATALDSLNAEAWYALGYGLAGLRGARDLEAGMTALQRGIALAPRATVPHRWLSLVYLRAGKYDDAVRENQTAVTLDPLSAISVADLAALIADLALRDSARALARRAVALDPLSPGVLSNAAPALFLTGDYSESLALIRTLEHSSETVPFASILQAKAADFAALGQRDSLAALARYVDRLPHTTQNLETIAVAAAAAGNWERAFAVGDTVASQTGLLDWLDGFPSIYKPVARDPRLQNVCRLARRDCAPIVKMIEQSLPLPARP